MKHPPVLRGGVGDEISWGVTVDVGLDKRRGTYTVAS